MKHKAVPVFRDLSTLSDMLAVDAPTLRSYLPRNPKVLIFAARLNGADQWREILPRELSAALLADERHFGSGISLARAPVHHAPRTV